MNKQIEEIVRKAKEIARQESDSEPEPGLVSPINWPVTCEVKPGLEGAITGQTEIGYVNGPKGWLIYRGLDVFDLSEFSSFEETSYLLLFGNLPTATEFESFNQKLQDYRTLPDEIYDLLDLLPVKQAHPMSTLRTVVSVLGMMDPQADITTVKMESEIAIKLIAQFVTITGAIARIRRGEQPLQPNKNLSLAADLIRMMTGKDPGEEDTRIMDICLILHADHGMNASTFASMVVNSSLSDMYSTVVAGIGSLKGPLHGGANEAVLADLEEIGSKDNVQAWYSLSKVGKRRIMGFGHRVYKAYDPRARILHPLADMISKRNPEVRRLYETAAELEKWVVGDLGKEKGIFPNVDFYSGIVYTAMNIEKAMFTPIFAVSRMSGWGARALEYLKNNRIFRPRAVYLGPLHVEYTPIDQRG
jgi:citrate synthase